MIVVSYFVQSCEVFDAITKFFAFQFCGQSTVLPVLQRMPIMRFFAKKTMI